jgi:hypothetical protein
MVRQSAWTVAFGEIPFRELALPELSGVQRSAAWRSVLQRHGMTVDEAAKLGEDFGVIVGDVDEEIQKELKLQRPQGVAVFEVIGNSRADYAGIKVRSVIKEIDKKEVRNMLDFGRHIKKAINECNFTVGTYEPADPGDPVGWGVNFLFVGCKRD